MAKYLVFRKTAAWSCIDDYDCYHETDSCYAIPTQYIVDLTEEQAKYVNSNKFVLLPFVTRKELFQDIDNNIKRAEEAEYKQKLAKEKRIIASRKRAEATAIRRKKRELKKLEELKAKYGE